MNNRNELEKLIIDNKPVKCKVCAGKMFYLNSGNYKCCECGHEEMDDFGKVKKYLEENGPTPTLVLAEATGVKVEIIEIFLRKGRLEIPEGSKYYLKCERCGCSIRFGRYCPSCTQELAGGIQRMLFEDMGARPKNTNSELMGRMRYLDRRVSMI